MIAAEESTPAPSSGRYGWAALFAAFVFIAATVTRVIVFVISDAARAPGGVVRAFAAGAVFDLLVALWTALPFMIAASFAGRRYAKRGRRVTRRVMLALAFALVVFIAAAEVVFFDEFDGRFNFVAVDYLLFPGEVVTNIWESYPLVWVLLGVGASAAAGVWSVRRWLARFDAAPAVAGRIRALHALGYAVIVASMSLAIGPRFAHVSNDRTLNEIASNGYYTFWQAVLGRDAPYDGWYATRPDSEVFARLHQLVPAPAPVTTTRAHPLNVILVLEDKLRLDVRRRDPSARHALDHTVLRLARRGRHAARARLLDRQPHDSRDRDDDRVDPAAARHLHRAARAIDEPVHAAGAVALARLHDGVHLRRPRDLRRHVDVHARQRLRPCRR